MTNLYTIVARNESTGLELSDAERSSVIYHDIFDYPLSFSELIKWKVGEGVVVGNDLPPISSKSNYFFISGKSGLVYKRILRKRISDKKLEIAKKAAKTLATLPSIRFIGMTGSLAMSNSDEVGDIDFLVVARKGTLWTTRLLSYLLIAFLGIPFRRAGRSEEKNRLCLNMWLDESDVLWARADANIYTAHEIAQIKPLVNKNKTYEKLLYRNRWILKYWPNSVKIQKYKIDKARGRQSIFEWLAYILQLKYMSTKMTREVVTPTRAIFHPQDWGKVVLDRIKSFSDAS